MGAPLDLSGSRFGRLAVVERAPNDGRRTMWRCRCDCGAETVVAANHLRSGRTASCGCLRRRHGAHGTATYKCWSSMRERCACPTHHAYPNYGGRGITVCDRWSGRDGFKNFLSDMGPRPPGMSLDRIDNERGYAPENCRWATRPEQQNNRRTNRHVAAFGQTFTLAQWAERTGIAYYVIRLRIDRGWEPERAVGTAVSQRRGGRWAS